MLPRQRTRTILSLGLPIMGGMVSQNVLNLVDSAMVGSLGDESLAAVGAASMATFLAAAFLMGLSAGVQAMAARRKGEGKEGETAVSLNGGLALSLLIGVPLSAALFLLAPVIFPLFNPDQAVIDKGVPYLQARLVAVTAIGVNFSFRGFWNGISRSTLYLYTLLIMHTANIILSAVLIFGLFGAPELGATGAGVGTAAATFLGSFSYVFLGLRHARRKGFLSRWPNAESLATLLRLSVPSGMQTLFFAAGSVMLFWILGQVGTEAQAASTVLIHILLVATLPGIGLGLAAASLAGQALGRRDPDDAKQWGWDVFKVAAVVMGTLGLPMVLFPELILSGFLRDPATLEAALTPLRLIGVATLSDAAARVLMNALLGAGDARRVMVTSLLLQWGLFLPAAYLCGAVLGLGLVGVWVCHVGYSLLQAVSYALLWRGGRWAHIRV